MALGIGQAVPGGAVDGLVLADVDIVRIGRDLRRALGDIGEVFVLGGAQNHHLAVFLRFGDGLFRPSARLHIAGLAVFHQVHGNHGKLQRAAALNEQDPVIVRDAHDLPQVGLGLLGDAVEDLGAVAHLHDAHTGTTVVHHFIPDLLQHLLRHHGRTGGKVISAIILHCDLPPMIKFLFKSPIKILPIS